MSVTPNLPNSSFTGSLIREGVGGGLFFSSSEPENSVASTNLVMILHNFVLEEWYQSQAVLFCHERFRGLGYCAHCTTITFTS
jgi:hypothetical protein